MARYDRYGAQNVDEYHDEWCVWCEGERFNAYRARCTDSLWMAQGTIPSTLALYLEDSYVGRSSSHQMLPTPWITAE
jgi:hypothetical protein